MSWCVRLFFMPAVVTVLAATAAGSSAARADDGGATVSAFDEAATKLWTDMALQTRVALFVTSGSNAFAQYEPRSAGAFRAGDIANIYLEPVGYGFAEEGGLIHVRFSTGVEIQRTDGIVMARSPDFGTFDWTGREKSFAVPATVSLALPDLRAGEYRLLVTLTDTVSGKALTATLSFTIAR